MSKRSDNPTRFGRAWRPAVVLTLAAALWLGLAGSSAGIGLWRLEIKAAACAAGERVLLSEIAVPVGRFPPDAWATLGATPLWTAPESVGRQAVIPAGTLYEALRYYLKDAPVEYVLPNQLTLTRGGRVVGKDELSAMAVEALTPRVEALGGEARIAAVDVPDYLFVEDRAKDVKVEAGDVGPGRIGLHFALTGADGKTLRKVPFTADIEQFANVPVAVRPLNPRDSLAAEGGYVLERRNLAQLKGRPFDPAGAGPWRLRRSVGQGQVIYADDLEVMPLILKGDKVQVTYAGKHVKLSLLAEALTDGAAGGKITVKNPGSSREVVGVVRDKNNVVVQ